MVLAVAMTADGTDPHLLAGRVAVVTGSSRGIGRAVAASMLQHGAAVVLNGRDEAALATTRRELSAYGPVREVPGSAHAVVADLVDAARDLGGVDILVNCAGTAEPPGSSILTVSRGEWDELIDAHLTSTFATCRAIAPLMVAAGGGSIVNTSSHAFTGIFGGTGYAAAKGGVTSLSAALAAELREHGVRVNTVCPGASTRLSTGTEYENTVEELHRRGLLDDLMYSGALSPPPPEYVARLYVFLASDDAAAVTGEVLVGAGGYLGRFPRPVETMLAYRDHTTSPPWSSAEIATALAGRQAAGATREGGRP